MYFVHKLIHLNERNIPFFNVWNKLLYFLVLMYDEALYHREVKEILERNARTTKKNDCLNIQTQPKSSM